MNVMIESSKRVPNLGWILKTDLNSLRSNLSDRQPILNQVECLLYLSRIHLEEIVWEGGIPTNKLEGLREEYEGLRQSAHEKFPALREYGKSKSSN